MYLVTVNRFGTVYPCGSNKLFTLRSCVDSWVPRETLEEVLYFDLRPGQTCHSKVIHRKEVTHSDGTYGEKSRRWTWLTKWDKEKIPWYTHRPMNRKRVTSELHDSYFRLMTIKHAIPRIEWAIEWALNYYITLSRQSETVGVRDEMWSGKPHQAEGAPWWVEVQRSCW